MAKYTDKVIENREKQHDKEKRCLYTIARIYVLVTLAIFPLYVGFDGYNDIIHSKALLFWNVAIVFFITFGIFYIVYWFGLAKEERPPMFWKTFSIPDWAVLAFLFIITVSCVLSPYKDMVFFGQTNRDDGWLTYFCMIMSYFVLSRWYKPKQFDFAMFSLSSMLVCIIAFIQYHGNDFLNLFPYHASAYVDRNGNPIYSGYTILFRSTIGNRDFISAYICITILVFGILYVKTKSPLRFLFFSAAVMNFDLMIISDGDAGKVGVLGAILLLLPYWLSERKILGRFLTLVATWGFTYVIHHWIMINLIMPGWNDEAPVHDQALKLTYSTLPLKTIFIICVVSLIVGLALIFLKRQAWPKTKTIRIVASCFLGIMLLGGILGIEAVGQKLPEKNIIYQAREVLHGRMQDNFGSGRGFVWRKSLEQFSAGQPLFGTGTDTFVHAFGKQNQEESQLTNKVVFDKAHNDFLQILLCNGILGLISYVALIVSLVLLSIKRAFDDDILLAALGGILAYFIQSFFGIDTITVTPLYWIMLAIIRQRQIEGTTLNQY